MKHIGFVAWILTMASIGGAIGWWAMDNSPPYEYIAEESFITPDPATPSSSVTADWKVKVNRVCPATSTRVLKDKDGKAVTTYDATPAATSIGIGDIRLKRTFQLPPILPDDVRYSSTVCFSCNPLQYVFPLCVSTPELPFRVAR